MAKIHFKSKGEGPAIVFLHGIGGGADSFDLQLDAVADAGYRAVAWDMPGYGGSDALNEVTFPALADALVQLLDDLGVVRGHVVGHSIGGMVVQQFARDHQDRLVSLVLAETSPAFGNPDGDFQRKFVAARLAPLDDGKSMADVAESVIPELVGDNPNAEGLALAQACMGRVPAEIYGATMRCLVTFEGRDALSDIHVPTLVLAGEKDTNAPAAMMERMAGKIAGSEFVCLPGAGHLANMEQPDAFNRAVLDFISRHA